MLIIGERINSTRESIAQAIKEKNSSFIQQEALKQVEAGADYVDVNAGIFMEEETRYLSWLVEVVQEATDKPLCIDTSKTEALAAALKACRNKALVSSITAEKVRYDAFLPLIKQYECSLSALCIDESGIPSSVQGRVEVTNRLISSLLADKIAPQDIYIDAIVQPIGADYKSGVTVLETIKQIKTQHPEVQTIVGLSNISFGLPYRRHLNQIFLVIAIQAGLDAAILDPCDKKIMAHITTAKALLGQDKHCLNYIKAYRSGNLD